MPFIKKESLERLKQRVNIVEALEPHLAVKKQGAAYKALCPFHDEKSPSFTLSPSDGHYHCFGCGAHGDAISFYMQQLGMSFSDAIEALAERFSVPLEYEEEEREKGPDKKRLYEALEEAELFYHALLLHTEEGHEALRYLESRGIDDAFVSRFMLGLAPKKSGQLKAHLNRCKFSDEELLLAGLLRESDRGAPREFFYQRILFPIHNPQGRVIGFSGRKYREETTGGKYVNTQETPLFKKTRVLFGINSARKAIAKERRALIVEGQIDCLRLHHEGLEIAVAGQGTAFGEGHVEELERLGVRTVYLAFDPDSAGQKAAVKVGLLFQKVGIGVVIVPLPAGKDPDLFVREKGIDAFIALMEKGEDFLRFFIDQLSKEVNPTTPAGKNEMTVRAVQEIRSWRDPVMVHEALVQTAHLLKVPETFVMNGTFGAPTYVRRTESAGSASVDGDYILETDFLRWLLLAPELLDLAKKNLSPEQLIHPLTKPFYEALMKNQGNWMAIALEVSGAQSLIADIQKKRVNLEKSEEGLKETMQRILLRNWQKERDQLHSELLTAPPEEKMVELVKRYDSLSKQKPELSCT